jgi:RNA polymerase sigma-70 factor (ECF subfamily)
MIRLTSLNLPWNAGRRATAPDPEMLARLCHADIYRYALRNTGHIESAEDVAADTFAAALDALHTFKGDTEPRLWLLGIARRKLADRARRQNRRPEGPFPDLLEPVDDASGPEGSVLSAEARQTMRRLVLALPEAQRQALLLQATEDLSITEIAGVMGRSSSSVNSLLGRARATLRERGAAYFGDSHE